MDAVTWLDLADRYGWPVLALFGIVYMLWRSRHEVVSREHHEQVVAILLEEDRLKMEELSRYRDLAYQAMEALKKARLRSHTHTPDSTASSGPEPPRGS